MRKTIYLVAIAILTLALTLAHPTAPTARADGGSDQPPPLFLRETERIGGELRATVLAGEWLYVARGRETALYDVSDPTAPLEGARIDHFTAQAESEGYLYGPQPELSDEWAVWDVRDPAAPRKVGTFAPSGEWVAADERALYFAGGGLAPALTIVSLADPAHPVLVSSWDEFTFVDNVFIVGTRLLVSGYYYQDDGPGGTIQIYYPLAVLDVGNLATPVRLATVPPVEIGLAFIAGQEYEGLLYLADQGGVQIVQMAADGTVTLVGSADTNRTVAFSYVVGYLYIVTQNQNLEGYQTEVWDARQPATPQAVGELDGWVSGEVQGDYLFRAVPGFSRSLYTPHYITVFNVADPAAPQPAAEITHPYGQELLQNSTYLYLFDGYYNGSYFSPIYLHTLAPTTTGVRLVRSDKIPVASAYGEFVVVAEDYLYAWLFDGDNYGSVQIYRLPTATNGLELVGEGPVAANVASLGTSLLISHPSGQVGVYSLDDPANPTLAATVPIAEFIESASDGNRLYLYGDRDLYGERTLFALDVTNPAAPIITNEFTPPEGQFIGNLLFAAQGHVYYQRDGLIRVADMRDGVVAAEVYTLPDLPNSYSSFALGVWEGRLYVHYETGVRSGIAFYDVSQPARPLLVGTYESDTSTLPFELLGRGSRLFGAEPQSDAMMTFDLVAGQRQFLPMVR